MPRKPRNQIRCEYFAWNLLRRSGVYYADGRANAAKLGKHSLGTRDREQALQAIKKLDLKMAIKHGLAEPHIVRTDNRLSIAEGWNRYLDHCERPGVVGGVSPGTLRTYRLEANRHQAYCEERGIRYWDQVDRREVEGYARSISRRYADATTYRRITVTKQALKWLVEERLLPEAHRVTLPLYRSEESETYCYSREQVQAMVTLCRARPSLRWLGDVIVLLATTGMRGGEAANLRWPDVDLENRMITLPDNRHTRRGRRPSTRRTNKGKRTRRVPIHDELLKVLQRLGGQEGGHVLRGPDGKAVQLHVARKLFVDEVITPLKAKFPAHEAEVGFGHGRFHSFRHYFVSQAFLGGASEGEIRSWVGHRNSRIVERYRHLADADARRKMAGIHFLTTPGSTADKRNENRQQSNGDDAAA